MYLNDCMLGFFELVEFVCMYILQTGGLLFIGVSMIRGILL